jgi:hypothetical protein
MNENEPHSKVNDAECCLHLPGAKERDVEVEKGQKTEPQSVKQPEVSNGGLRALPSANSATWDLRKVEEQGSTLYSSRNQVAGSLNNNV